MYGSLQCRNVIDNLAYTITEVKNYLYSPKLDFVFDNNFLFGGGGGGGGGGWCCLGCQSQAKSNEEFGKSLFCLLLTSIMK